LSRRFRGQIERTEVRDYPVSVRKHVAIIATVGRHLAVGIQQPGESSSEELVHSPGLLLLLMSEIIITIIFCVAKLVGFSERKQNVYISEIVPVSEPPFRSTLVIVRW
ncbi:hypothetical protein RRG08_064428, partial [Elysia crispata]